MSDANFEVTSFSSLRKTSPLSQKYDQKTGDRGKIGIATLEEYSQAFSSKPATLFGLNSIPVVN